jgi:hypothetical protein
VLAVVFEYAYLNSILGDTITIEYDAASVPEVFSVVANPGLVGGVMTVLASVVATDIISVTTFNRTTQQSLVTQSITDATVSRISSVVAALGAPVLVTTAIEHDLEPKDYVGINGAAAPDLDGNKYYVKIVDQFTVELYSDYDLTIPVSFFSTGPLNPAFQSYIQVINVNETPVSPTPMSIDQPDYSMFDTTRLWVTLIRPASNPIDPDLRFYIPPAQIIIENNTLVLLEQVLPTDVIIITSMVPTASPDETRFRINLDKYNGVRAMNIANEPNASVYRENQPTRTYLSQDMNTTFQISDQLVVADPYRLVEITTYTRTITARTIDIVSTTSAIVTSVTVTTAGGPVTDFAVGVINNNTIRLTFIVTPDGTSVEVAVALGNTLMIAAEQISFSSINMATGVISGLRRGMNGTIVNMSMPAGTKVQSVLPSNLLNSMYYMEDWYELGSDIPLQYSVTPPANFLNTTV